MIDEAIHTLITGIAGITSVVSSRFYRGTLPELTPLPALVYDITTTEYEESMTGSSRLGISRVEFSAFGKTKLDARDLREAVRQGCHGYRGVVGSTTIHSVIDWFDEQIFEDEPGVWDATCQCSIWHSVPD